MTGTVFLGAIFAGLAYASSPFNLIQVQLGSSQTTQREKYVAAIEKAVEEQDYLTGEYLYRLAIKELSEEERAKVEKKIYREEYLELVWQNLERFTFNQPQSMPLRWMQLSLAWELGHAITAHLLAQELREVDPNNRLVSELARLKL